MTPARQKKIQDLLLGGAEECPACGQQAVVLSGAKLRAIRENHMSLSELARRVNLSGTYVSHLERGIRTLSLTLADRLLQAMGV